MDLYELLGAKRSATAAELRRAFKRQARRFHPDLNPGDPVAAEKFRSISRAFDVLSNPSRRAEYDRGELAAVSDPGSVPQVDFEGFDFSSEVSGKGAGFQEIFDGLLGSGPELRREPEHGEHLQQVARISFEEALTGAQRRVHLVRQDLCPICRGAGDVPFGPVPCPSCQGAGQIRASRGHMIFSKACPTCSASGQLDRRPCSRCRGDGRLMQSEWLDVQIPPGVSDGSKVRIPECGNAGRRGGRAGDFVLAIEVAEHPFYRREGHDLHCVVPVTIFEAALGGHIEVPTPGGPVTVELPAGTQPGHRLRLRKRGAPKLGGRGRGDLYVEVRLWVPTPSDEGDRELLRELAKRCDHDPRQELVASVDGETEE